MAQSNMFDRLPPKASSKIEPYNLHIAAPDLKQMLDLLNLSPIADPLYENSLPDGDRQFGVRRDWLVEAKRVWKAEFDWKVVSCCTFPLLTTLKERNRKSGQLVPQLSNSRRR